MSEMSDLTPEAARLISEFPARLPAEPVARMEALARMQAAEEAGLAARGVCPVSVVHPAETAATAAVISDVLPRLAEQAGPFSATRGGNDYTTWFFAGPDAERAAVAFVSAVTAIAPPGWVITPTAHPVFYR